MYAQAEPVRSPFSGPGSRQTSGHPLQPRPVRQSGSRGRVRHDHDKQREDQDTSSHTYEDAEAVRGHATHTSADCAYPGGVSGRRGVCSFLRARRSCLAAGIAVLLSLAAVGLAPLTFSNIQEISQLSTTVTHDQDNLRQLNATVDALKSDQDNLRQLSATVDALRRDQDALKVDQDNLRQLFAMVDALKSDHQGNLRLLSTTVNALKRDQDGMSTAVNYLKRDLDNERSRTTTLEQRLRGIEKTLRYTIWHGICYKAFNTRKSFSEAAAACRADGGTLAMPRDADTRSFLISLYKSVSDHSFFWIGLHDQREEGRFEWVDRSALGPYSSWDLGQPDNGRSGRLGNEDCVLYSSGPPQQDKWHDYDCPNPFSFICQADPGRAQATSGSLTTTVQRLSDHPQSN
ncbi:PREDICTED: C-type lectin domain family 4 member F-like [Branchiostoma belcheri]|uniref:C-type lectin domain family 4 member F-like n=1 Tax=Branchiostoma belcheri TaxID=7741 RepID=A0A6P5A9D0_BRABE|nr:PREDICTED: C-type lectin domain family 4 member F-like [Branchiostoma belcheri]